jgi:hypothetical protein
MFSILRVELQPAHLRRRRSVLTTRGGFGRRRRQTPDPIRGSPDSSPARLGESSVMVFPAAASIRSGLQMEVLAAALLTARCWNRVRGMPAAGELDAQDWRPGGSPRLASSTAASSVPCHQLDASKLGGGAWSLRGLGEGEVGEGKGFVPAST